MFEYWSDEFSASLRRVIDPPAPVLVDLSVALAPQGPFRRDQVSLRIKRAGLDCTIKVPGLLYAWAQCADNSWIGLVGFAIPTANGRGRIETRQWTVATALSRGGDPSLRG
ncbi:hypothetical protein DFR70_1263 [Nocardia tenerifensis]|uniref:Uncharacterized protein n=1 Tax=Nocardia tenerifensis TaxID=228006 RepID=A0A318JM69_9NOCA|nr:hypothetical protein [Nocardia tenerifensis]PXX53882.1 hypothetical protein DFR70_1263 [Nocardia tenerifensis]